MKVLQIVPSISKASSGLTSCVPALCHSLSVHDIDVELHVLEKAPEGFRDINIKQYPRHTFPHPHLGRSPEMFAGLAISARNASIVHNNSLWMLPNIYPGQLPRTGFRLVTSPHGTLAEWALKCSRWRKKAMLLLGQRHALEVTDLFIATSMKEYCEIRNFDLSQPVAVIPNGVVLPSNFPKGSDSTFKLVFLSRIHPTKRLDLLLAVWARLVSQFPNWELLIAGPDKENSYATMLKKYIVSHQVPQCRFVGEQTGEEKWRFLAEADCFVLPTESENFGMVVAEALISGTPVVCSQGAPWEGLVHERAGRWIPLSEDSFESTLREVMSLPRSELIAMGERGRAWMQRDFSWDSVGAKMMQAYTWILNGGSKPSFIYED